MPDLTLIAALFGVSFVAGLIDAIAGGGGLLTVPALLLAGLDPVAAIATNKVQGTAGALSSTIAFARRGMIDWKRAAPAAIAASLAAIAGAIAANLAPRSWLEAFVPVLLIAVALYFALRGPLQESDSHARMTPALFAATLAPAVGFYDGLFGPGAGSFYMVGYVSLLGLGIVRATANTKLLNAASNIGGLALFAASGVIVWSIGLAMALGAFLGAQAGSRLAIRHGARIIKPLIVVICFAMAIKLLADPANPLSIFARGLFASR